MQRQPEERKQGFLNHPCLRTLHIRNSPIQSVDLDGVRDHYLEHITQARAHDLLIRGLGLDYQHANAGKVSPRLQALIIGPLTYTHRWELSIETHNDDSTKPFRMYPTWKRPMVFSIEYLRGRFGRRIFALDQWEFENIRDLANYFQVRCLESVWLG